MFVVGGEGGFCLLFAPFPCFQTMQNEYFCDDEFCEDDDDDDDANRSYLHFLFVGMI